MKTQPYHHRLAMYDYARGQAVRESYLLSLLDTVRDLKLTGLAVYLEDLAMFLQPTRYSGSIALDGWRRLDAEAHTRGLVLLPLLNFYGHCQQTLAHPEYAALSDDVAGTTLNYSLPTTRDLVRQSLDIALGVFRSPYIHIGFDEVWGLGYSAEKRTGKPANVPSLFAKNLTWVTGEVTRRGRRPMFWADVASVYYPEIIPDLPRELIPVDWFYRVEPRYPSLRCWTDAGFDLWVAPTIGCSDRAWPDNPAWQPHAQAVLHAGTQAGASGVIFTAWEQPPAPFSARLPMLEWQARLAAGKTRPSLRRLTARWLQSRHLADASLTLGSLNGLLPAEARDQFPALPALRRTWYQHDPRARAIHRKIRRILHRTAPAAAQSPELALAHARFTFWADALDPKKITPSRLLHDLRRLEPKLRVSWKKERLPAQFETEVTPSLAQLARQLVTWPSADCGPAPRYAPSLAHAARNCPPSTPTITALFEVSANGPLPEADPTSVFIWHTPTALHLRFHCLQTKPPRAAETSVDFLLVRDDSVSLCLDFHGCGQGYLWIESNPAGTTFCQWHNEKNENSEWHPLAGKKNWATPKKFPAGWSIEFRFPFARLGIPRPAPGSTMGLTLSRRRSWNHAPASSWGGLGWLPRDHPRCLSRLILA